MNSNPYASVGFFEFFQLLFSRLYGLASGELSLAPDEVQLVTLLLISIACAAVGCFLVLRKMAMMTNAISHTILIGIVLAYFWTRFGAAEELNTAALILHGQLLLIASVLSAFATSFLSQFLVSSMGLREDASCGIVFTILFALGVLLVTLLSRNAHVGAELLMGNADAIHLDDLQLQWKMTLVDLLLLELLSATLYHHL